MATGSPHNALLTCPIGTFRTDLLPFRSFGQVEQRLCPLTPFPLRRANNCRDNQGPFFQHTPGLQNKGKSVFV